MLAWFPYYIVLRMYSGYSKAHSIVVWTSDQNYCPCAKDLRNADMYSDGSTEFNVSVSFKVSSVAVETLCVYSPNELSVVEGHIRAFLKHKSCRRVPRGSKRNNFLRA